MESDITYFNPYVEFRSLVAAEPGRWTAEASIHTMKDSVQASESEEFNSALRQIANKAAWMLTLPRGQARPEPLPEFIGFPNREPEPEPDPEPEQKPSAVETEFKDQPVFIAEDPELEDEIAAPPVEMPSIPVEPEPEAVLEKEAVQEIPPAVEEAAPVAEEIPKILELPGVNSTPQPVAGQMRIYPIPLPQSAHPTIRHRRSRRQKMPWWLPVYATIFVLIVLLLIEGLMSR